LFILTLLHFVLFNVSADAFLLLQQFLQFVLFVIVLVLAVLLLLRQRFLPALLLIPLACLLELSEVGLLETILQLLFGNVL
jgi:hypothetical protein